MVQADLWEETELNLEGWGIVRHGTKRDENYSGRENKNSNNIKKSYCFLESLWKYKQYKVGEWREEKLRGWVETEWQVFVYPAKKAVFSP